MADWVSFAAAGTKVKDTAMLPRTQSSTLASLAASTWRTDFEIAGSGYLHMLAYRHAVNWTYAYLRVTVDGGTPFVVGDSSSYGMVNTDGSPTHYVGCMPTGNVRFKSSLKVEVYNAHTSAQNVASAITYSLL